VNVAGRLRGFILRRLLRPRFATVGGIRIDVRHPAFSRRVQDAFYKGSYERDEREVLAATLRPDDRLLEIGAGIGVLALTALARLGDPCRILAYEADPATADAARAVMALNRREVPLLARAVTLAGGPVAFRRAENFWASRLAGPAEAGDRQDAAPGHRRIEVGSDALPEVIAAFRPTYLLMDVEGAETELLGGCDIPGVRAVCVEIHPARTGEAAVAAMRGRLAVQGFVEQPAISRGLVRFFARGP
jgi:FkbM family methyltransferase